VLKSPAVEASLTPMRRLAALAAAEYEQTKAGQEVAAKVAKMQADLMAKAAAVELKKNPKADVTDLLRFDAPDEPTLRRYYTTDSTAAALGELLRQNPNGLLVHRDELVSLLRSLDQEDNAAARGFYLTGWNGNSPYTIDRIGRGMNLHIDAVCLSILGSTQPGRIAEYVQHAVRGGKGDDGLVQRFGLLVWPDVDRRWTNVDREPDRDAGRAVHDVFHRLDRLDWRAIGAERDIGPDGDPDGLPYLRFDDKGQEIFNEWRVELEARLRSDELHPALEAHLSKYRKLVPGLALICHLTNGEAGAVPGRAVVQALGWAQYLETHARRVYASVVAPESDVAKAIIKKLQKGDLPRSFSTRDVWRPGWAMLSDRGQVADALQLLVELDWLTTTRTETGGRPATIYHANPRGLQ
jgi:putative DNA primase/helicase